MNLSARQQAEILAELLAAAVHWKENFQTLITEEMEKLPADDELE